VPGLNTVLKKTVRIARIEGGAKLSRPDDCKEIMMANILIIDDQAAVREALSDELSRAGHAVESVGDVKSLLNSMEKLNPDVVLLDLYLDGYLVKGFRTLESLKEKIDSVYP